MKLTLPQLKQLSSYSMSVGGGYHLDKIPSSLSTNFVLAREEKKLGDLKNSIGSISKLLKLTTNTMYMQRYMVGTKVMRHSFHTELVGIIEMKAVELGRTAPAGAGSAVSGGGSLVGRLLRGLS